MSKRGDLLDRLARRSAEAGRSVRHAQSASEIETRTSSFEAVETPLSRGSALKLAAAGGASFLLGLRNAPLARAQTITRGQCFDLCLDAADRRLDQKLDACIDLFTADAWLEKSNWKRIKRAFRYGPYSFGWDFWSFFPTGVCVIVAANDVRGIKNSCLDQCQETCPPRRSLQSAASPTAPTCEVKKPPKSKPPQIPPPPGSQFWPCGGGDTPYVAPYCCPTVHSPYGVTPCQVGCHRSGEGCCGGSDCG